LIPVPLTLARLTPVPLIPVPLIRARLTPALPTLARLTLVLVRSNTHQSRGFPQHALIKNMPI
jgi:hypothetical protein